MPTIDLGFVNLTTPDYRWLREEAWKIEDFASFQELKSQEILSVYKPVPFFREKKTPNATACEKWLLCDAQGKALGSALAQGFFRVFRQIFVFCGPYPATFEQGGQAVGLLISSLFILKNVDTIHLLSEDEGWQRALKELNAPLEVSPIECLRADWLQAEQVFCQRQRLSIQRVEWQESELGAKTCQMLSYLSVRKERVAKGNNLGRNRRFLPRRRN